MKLREWQIEDGEWRASVLECGSPLPLAHGSKPTRGNQSARGQAQSKTSRSLFTVFKFTLIFTFALSAHAQNFTNDSFKIGGGGGTITGGVYSATGTIGQPDASTLSSSGQYSADNGFWGIAAVVQMPGSPPLSITHSGTNAVISWSASFTGFVLERNPDLNNPNGWANPGDSVVVSNGQNTVTVPISGFKYYRLRK